MSSDKNKTESPDILKIGSDDRSDKENNKPDDYSHLKSRHAWNEVRPVL